MRAIILSGGNIDADFALNFIEETEYDVLIAADRGMDFCRAYQLPVSWLVGDFDSAGREVLAFYESQGLQIRRLRPQKDDSDTQAAIALACELGADAISLLGATGTRLDHMLANLQSIIVCQEEKGIRIEIYDAHNRVTVHTESFQISKEQQFGTYVSFFPVGGMVCNLSLSGFRYLLKNHDLSYRDSSLTVSNEIVDRAASVTFTEGILLMIQTRD